MPPENDSPLERARRRLYGTVNTEQPLPAPNEFAPQTSAQPWSPEPQAKKKISLGALFLIIALAFFVLAGVIAGTVLYFGGRSVSSDRIDISVEGPTTVAGGDTVPLFVVLKNGNPVAATNVTLSADFPDGAYSADNHSTPLGHFTASMDDIPSGSSARESIRAVFFGAENQKVTVPITLEYKTPNSSATFVKKMDYVFTISTTPLSVNVTSLSQVGAGQPFTVIATIRSNAPSVLENVAVQVQYPFGFIPASTSPTAVAEGIFSLGTFKPGEQKDIRITGTISGEDGDQRVFKFFAGTLEAPGGVKLATPAYTEQDSAITLTKAFLATTLTLNQSNTDPLIIHAGDSVFAALSWVNTLATSVTNAQLTVGLTGDAIDFSSVKTTNGFYQSNNRTVSFTSDTQPGLHVLAPDDTGNGSLSFNTKTGADAASLRNPIITLTVSIAGQGVSGNGGTQTMTSALKRTIKLASDLTLTSDAVHSTGPFKNTGPLPPVVGKETTYTVWWTAKNTVNSIANAQVSVVLPTYVRFTGQTSGTVTYNETTRAVTWTIGDMAAGATQQAAFQVGLTPSSSQKGTNPLILPPQTITGFDRFVQQQIKSGAEQVTGELTNDPVFQLGDERVQ